MKIVFINTGTKQLNAGIVRCLGLGKGLVQCGHDVTILISDDQENINLYGDRFDGINFVYMTNQWQSLERSSLLVSFAYGAMRKSHSLQP